MTINKDLKGDVRHLFRRVEKSQWTRENLHENRVIPKYKAERLQVA